MFYSMALGNGDLVMGPFLDADTSDDDDDDGVDEDSVESEDSDDSDDDDVNIDDWLASSSSSGDEADLFQLANGEQASKSKEHTVLS